MIPEEAIADVIAELAAARRARGRGPGAIAHRVGVSPAQITNIEKGHSLPSVETLFRYAAAVGRSIKVDVADRAPEDFQ